MAILNNGVAVPLGKFGILIHVLSFLYHFQWVELFIVLHLGPCVVGKIHGECVCDWCWRNTRAFTALLFSTVPFLIVLVKSEDCAQAGHLRDLNNALGQPLVLIAGTNLLCGLKSFTYFALGFPCVKQNWWHSSKPRISGRNHDHS